MKTSCANRSNMKGCQNLLFCLWVHFGLFGCEQDPLSKRVQELWPSRQLNISSCIWETEPLPLHKQTRQVAYFKKLIMKLPTSNVYLVSSIIFNKLALLASI